MCNVVHSPLFLADAIRGREATREAVRTPPARPRPRPAERPIVVFAQQTQVCRSNGHVVFMQQTYPRPWERSSQKRPLCLCNNRPSTCANARPFPRTREIEYMLAIGLLYVSNNLKIGDKLCRLCGAGRCGVSTLRSRAQCLTSAATPAAATRGRAEGTRQTRPTPRPTARPRQTARQPRRPTVRPPPPMAGAPLGTSPTATR